MNRRALLAAALASLFLAQAPTATADTLADIKKAGVLKVAVPQDYPPFGSVGGDMKPIGYDVDMAAMIAKDLGVKVELVPVTSANRIPYLTTHKVDLVISSLGKTPEREKVIDFSTAYAPYFTGVFGPAEEKVAKAEDLAGKVVGVTRGTLEDLELTKIVPASTTIKRFEDNNSTISAFLSGQVQLVGIGNVVAAAIIAKNPPKKPEPKFLIKDSPCFVGMNKGETALMGAVNASIAKARQSGALTQVSQKWLGLPLPATL
jgi:polar amino acid transport system substrate-binding protein